jgi:hypothetical protein
VPIVTCGGKSSGVTRICSSERSKAFASLDYSRSFVTPS